MREWNLDDPRWMTRVVDSAEVAATKKTRRWWVPDRHKGLWACDDDVRLVCPAQDAGPEAGRSVVLHGEGVVGV
jgi:hypothetical protein